MAAAGPGRICAISNSDGMVVGVTTSKVVGGMGGGTTFHGEEEDCIGRCVFRSLSPLPAAVAVARRVLESPTRTVDGQ